CEVDDRTESLNKKVREAQINKIPLILTIGEKEKQSTTLSVRTLDGKVTYGVTRDQFFKEVLEHISDRALTMDIFS
nr:threonine--tRNA ligase [Deltaproteobacteria bacterium]